MVRTTRIIGTNRTALRKLLDQMHANSLNGSLSVEYLPGFVEKRDRTKDECTVRWDLSQYGIYLLVYYLVHLRPQLLPCLDTDDNDGLDNDNNNNTVGGRENGVLRRSARNRTANLSGNETTNRTTANPQNRGNDRNVHHDSEQFLSLFYHTVKRGVQVNGASIRTTARRSYAIAMRNAGLTPAKLSEYLRVVVTAMVLRRTYATYAYTQWVNGHEEWSSHTNSQSFLMALASDMNTSPEQLENVYIARNTVVDTARRHRRAHRVRFSLRRGGVGAGVVGVGGVGAGAGGVGVAVAHALPAAAAAINNNNDKYEYEDEYENGGYDNDETRGVLKVFLENVIRDAVTYTEHAKRK